MRHKKLPELSSLRELSEPGGSNLADGAALASPVLVKSLRQMGHVPCCNNEETNEKVQLSVVMVQLSCHITLLLYLCTERKSYQF